MCNSSKVKAYVASCKTSYAVTQASSHNCNRPSYNTYYYILRINSFSRKEVIHRHVLVPMPCYDLTPIISPTLGRKADFGCWRLSWFDGRCVQDQETYSPQHADLRLLAIPTSKRRVSASYPNWDRLWCDLLHITASLRIVPAIVARF